MQERTLEKSLECTYKYLLELLEKEINNLSLHSGKFKDDTCQDFKIAIAENYGKLCMVKAILNHDFGYDLKIDAALVEKYKFAVSN